MRKNSPKIWLLVTNGCRNRTAARTVRMTNENPLQLLLDTALYGVSYMSDRILDSFHSNSAQLFFNVLSFFRLSLLVAVYCIFLISYSVVGDVERWFPERRAVHYRILLGDSLKT